MPAFCSRKPHLQFAFCSVRMQEREKRARPPAAEDVAISTHAMFGSLRQNSTPARRHFRMKRSKAEQISAPFTLPKRSNSCFSSDLRAVATPVTSSQRGSALKDCCGCRGCVCSSGLTTSHWFLILWVRSPSASSGKRRLRFSLHGANRPADLMSLNVMNAKLPDFGMRSSVRNSSHS